MTYKIHSKEEGGEKYQFSLFDNVTNRCSNMFVDRATFQAFKIGDEITIAMSLAPAKAA